MKSLVNRCFRLAFKIAYPIFVRVHPLLGIKLRGVFVVIWHEDRLLVVKNSYKPCYSLPGGLLKRHEDAFDGAVRETREEVGVELSRDQLVELGSMTDRLGGIAYVVAARLSSAPAVHIDQREIVWAEFVTLEEAHRLGMTPEIDDYLPRLQAARDAIAP